VIDLWPEEKPYPHGSEWGLLLPREAERCAGSSIAATVAVNQRNITEHKD
jgi:hypothetical protein